MHRRSLRLPLVLLFLTTSACITGRDDPDSGTTGTDGVAVQDGPQKKDGGKQDQGKKDTGEDVGKKNGGSVPGKWVKIPAKCWRPVAYNGLHELSARGRHGSQWESRSTCRSIFLRWS